MSQSRLGRRIAIVAAAAVSASLVTVPAAARPAPPRAEAAEPGRGVPGGLVRAPALPASAADTTDRAWRSPVAEPAGAAEVAVTRGWRRAGALPILVKGAGGGVDRVRVRTRETANGTLTFTVARADGGRSRRPVAVSVDPAYLGRRFGGDFALRARLVDRASGRVLARPVHARGRTTLGSAVEAAPGDGATRTYAVTSTSSGPTSDFKATPFQHSDTWSVGPSSGNFSYEYALPMPPALGGPVPDLTLRYSSQAVDGRTANENGQPSQIGEGWSMSPGHIERRTNACADEGHANSGDLCIGKAEWYLTLGGRSGEIVRGVGDEWRLRDDPGWRILSQRGAANGTPGGDYFVVRTQDGTKYTFGTGSEPTTGTATHSAWNVPMFGDDPGEACYSTLGFNSSWCQQTWRWNLERIEDPLGNVVSLFWRKEGNRYARNRVDTAVSRYDRGGYLGHVEYTKRAGAEGTTPAKVNLNYLDRCSNPSPTTGACPYPPTAANGTWYPDVPLDLECTSDTLCADVKHESPSFWSTKRLDNVVTSVRSAANVWTSLDRVDLTHEHPATGDGTTPSLWLREIRRVGLRGTANGLGLPPVRFEGVALQNRQDTASGVPAANKFRVNAIVNELGGRASVTYGQPNPCSAPYPQWDHNETDCFPQHFKPDLAPAGFGIFRKYQVLSVTEDERTGTSPPLTTTYQYWDKPAWHYLDSLILPDGASGRQSWSAYRGYGTVVVRRGSTTSRSETVHHTFRGMDGDKLANGTARDVWITDSAGTSFEDKNHLAGYELEVTVRDNWSTELRKTLNRWWAWNTVAGPSGFQPHAAQYVRIANVTTKVMDTTTVPSVVGRQRQLDRTYSTSYGVVTSAQDHGDLAVTGDETCVRTDRAYNVGAWIVDRPYRNTTVSGDCDSTAVVAKEERYYDGAALGAAVTAGRLTSVARYPDPWTPLTTRFTYDVYGRVLTTELPKDVAEATGRVERVTFAPATGVLPSSVTRKNRLLHQEVVELTLGLPTRTTDANGFVTTMTYDELGRLKGVQRPLDTAGPGIVYDYWVDGTKATAARLLTRRFQDATRYVDTFAYVDGLGRTIQEEVTAVPDATSGRTVTATRFDDRDHVAARTDPYWDPDNAAGAGVHQPAYPVPHEERYLTDAADRLTDVIEYANGAELWRTHTAQFGVRRVVERPTADTVQGDRTEHLDVWGAVTRIVEDGVAADVTTQFEYDPLRRLRRVVDTNGNQTLHTYDWLGRTKSVAGPNSGTASTDYDENGNVERTTDARATEVVTTYDAIDRPRTRTSGGVTLATWDYDGATNGVGRLQRAVSTGTGYTHTDVAVRYDERGRLAERRFDVDVAAPFDERVDGSYTYTYGYDRFDQRTATRYPAAGGATGLAAETVTRAYDSHARPSTLTGDATYGSPVYVDHTYYREDGKLADLGLGTGTHSVRRGVDHDEVAGRLAHLGATVQTAAGEASLEQREYRYDADGNVTSVTDETVPGAGLAECFFYADGLSRLTAAYTTTAGCAGAAITSGEDRYRVDYTYAANGNRLTDTSAVESATSATRTYGYDGANKPHALRRVDGSTPDRGYSASGSLTTVPSGAGQRRYEWDAQDRLAWTAPTTTGAADASFGYDTAGGRVLRADASGTVLYLDGTEVKAVPGSVEVVRYYGDSALRRNEPNGLWWLVRNHQGSLTIAVNAATGTVARRTYLPFGSYLSADAAFPTDRAFLGAVRDATTGLDALGARYYDAAHGRFTAVDPLADPANPQSRNGYAYALNNPVTTSDPTGLMVDDRDARGAPKAPAPPPPPDPIEEIFGPVWGPYVNGDMDLQPPTTRHAFAEGGTLPGSNQEAQRQEEEARISLAAYEATMDTAGMVASARNGRAEKHADAILAKRFSMLSRTLTVASVALTLPGEISEHGVVVGGIRTGITTAVGWRVGATVTAYCAAATLGACAVATGVGVGVVLLVGPAIDLISGGMAAPVERYAPPDPGPPGAVSGTHVTQSNGGTGVTEGTPYYGNTIYPPGYTGPRSYN